MTLGRASGRRVSRLSPRRRRARRRLDRTTAAIGVLALTTTAAAMAGELGRVWRRGSAPLPAEADDVLAAAGEAARQSVEVAVEGYRTASMRENVLLNLLGSFVVTFGAVRTSTWLIRSRGEFGPFRELVVGPRHIHHFVPGIAIALLAGGAALVTENEALERWLAIAFGVGGALTLDESALLLQLEDVYWSEEGILSVQITLAAISLLGAMAVVRRTLRRGEAHVLPAGGSSAPATG
ncbi:MAG TPA: hypothetical protein VKA96_08565 [Solirubrobacteraceae bacterium]|nr:hypothetical protein [Solirubrobacteraceae bacterium]